MSISLRGDAAKSGVGSCLSASVCRSGIVRCGLIALLAGILGLASTNQAKAQITVKSLIGKSVSNPTDEKYPEIVKAIQYFTNRDPSAALGQLTIAKQHDKSLPPAEMMLAQMWLMANQGNQARSALEECIKNNPTDPEAYLVLGDLAFSDRQITAAELLFTKAEQLSANFTENPKRANDFRGRAEAGLAAVAESREQWDTARTYLEKWVKIVDPDGSREPNKNAPANATAAAAHDRLGRTLFHVTGPADAYKQFTYAVNADDKSVSPDIALAQLYEEAKDHSEAKRFIGRAVTHLNGPPESQMATLLAAARWALDTNQADDAFNYASQALKQEPNSKRALEAKFLMGVAARMKGDTKTAEQALEEVFMHSPGNFQASNQLAQVLAEQTDPDKKQRGLEIATNNQAAASSGDAARRDPGRAIEAAATLGWVLFEMDRIPEAGQVMQAIMNTGVASPDILYYRARLYQETGQTKDAITSLRAALKGRGFFVHRDDAQQMLAKLDKSHNSGSSESTETTPDNTTPTPTPPASASPDNSKTPPSTTTPSSNSGSGTGAASK